jgi:hypothetical protein
MRSKQIVNALLAVNTAASVQAVQIGTFGAGGLIELEPARATATVSSAASTGVQTPSAKTGHRKRFTPTFIHCIDAYPDPPPVPSDCHEIYSDLQNILYQTFAIEPESLIRWTLRDCALSVVNRDTCGTMDFTPAGAMVYIQQMLTCVDDGSEAELEGEDPPVLMVFHHPDAHTPDYVADATCDDASGHDELRRAIN